MRLHFDIYRKRKRQASTDARVSARADLPRIPSLSAGALRRLPLVNHENAALNPVFTITADCLMEGRLVCVSPARDREKKNQAPRGVTRVKRPIDVLVSATPHAPRFPVRRSG